MNSYQKLVSIKNISVLDTDQAVSHIGLMADAAFEARKEKGLRQALLLADQVAERPLTDAQKTIFFYHISNVWGNLHKLSIRNDTDLWRWDDEAVEKQMIWLRRSLNVYQSMAASDRVRINPCPVYANLAATMSHVGRFVEALAYWDRALSENPGFALARGNRGYVRMHYAHSLYDESHALIFLRKAMEDLDQALKQDLDSAARALFSEYLSDLLSVFDRHPAAFPDLETGSPESAQPEADYRSWCLQNRLFINPLNDLAPGRAGASDSLSLPSMVVKQGDAPDYHGFFNLLKQEFVSARWLYYEGVACDRTHFSDRNVLLYDTLDHPVYGLAAEKVKIAFRVAYALFDKIAFFLKNYLSLDVPDKKINARTLWHEPTGSVKTLRPQLADLQNWPLRGLYWLCKDLYEAKQGFEEALEPEARKLHGIRNYMEHRYFKLQKDSTPNARPAKGQLVFSVSITDFQAKTLQILKMVRAALIYLSLSVHREETRRAEKRQGEVDLPVWELRPIADGSKK